MAKNDKKIYRDIIERITQPISATALMKIFAKGIAHSQDGELKKLIQPAHAFFMKVATSSGGNKKSNLMTFPLIKPIMAYCIGIARNEKPMWQIQAERAGWAKKV